MHHTLVALRYNTNLESWTCRLLYFGRGRRKTTCDVTTTCAETSQSIVPLFRQLLLAHALSARAAARTCSLSRSEQLVVGSHQFSHVWLLFTAYSLQLYRFTRFPPPFPHLSPSSPFPFLSFSFLPVSSILSSLWGPSGLYVVNPSTPGCM